ncbi:MAG: fatty acid hydroxylase, partial [Chitinophagaceae bacterium]
MEFQKIHNKGQAQLFKNQYLEYLTKTHPLVIWGMYVPVIAYFIYFGITERGITGLQSSLIFLAGMFFWSFTEYIMHRFAFHSNPKSERGKRIKYVMHGNHHEFPRDKERLFMPA